MKRVWRGAGRVLFGLLLWLGSPHHALANNHYLWLSASLNQDKRGDILAIKDPDSGQLLLETDKLQDWGILYRRSSVVRIVDETSFSVLDSIQGLGHVLHEEQATVALQMDPSLLPVHYIVNQPKTRQQVQRGRGFHLNYDSLLQRIGDDTALSGLLQPVVFGSWGFVRSSHRLRYDGQSRSSNSLRLDTVFSRDWVDQRVRLNLGDLVSAADSFGRRQRLGGIQIHREFSIRPSERSFASPRISGIATLPSDVELFINGTRQGGFSTPPGPFELRDPPVMTGAGTAQLVITNALGEQTVQSLNFYVDPQLLKAGLLDFDLAAGWQRQDYALASDRYADLSAHGQLRYGLNSKLTLQASAVQSSAFSNLEVSGVAAAFDWPVTLTLGAGLWRVPGEDEGLIGRIGLDTRQGAWFAGVQGLVSEAAASNQVLPLHSQWLARIGRRWGHWQWHADSVYRKRSAEDRFSRQNLRLSRSWQRAWGHTTFSAGVFRSRDSQGLSDSGALLYLRFSPDRRQAISLSSGADQRVSARYQHQSRQELGHRFEAQTTRQRDFSLRSAQWRQNRESLQWRAHWQEFSSQSAISVGASGALGRLRMDSSAHWFSARQLGLAYAVADLQGQANIPLYLHNRVVTHSDARGVAVIPQLRPYESNPVSINPLDLPLNVQLDQTDFDMVPGHGSGVGLSLPLGQGRSAQFRLMLHPGIVVPEGAVIRQPDDQGQFYVGRDGQAYVDSLRRPLTEYRVYWQDQQCAFSIALTKLPNTLMPHIGAIQCD